VRKKLKMACLALALATTGWAVPAFAVRPDEMLADPALEARARALSRELRCLVCQNESIDDSNADLAHDLRVLVRDRIQEGDTDRQAIDYIVARYGEFVLLKPRFDLRNAALWGTPVALLLAGGLVMVFGARRRHRTNVRPLSNSEQQEVDRILSSRERRDASDRPSAPS
jgi:cytochrome c-type biogenesis protein CcmH